MKKSAATAISALFWRNAGRRASVPWRPALIPRLPGSLVAGEEFRFAHQRDVPRLLARHPVGVLLALERKGIERALLREPLPLRRLLDLAQQVDVVLDLILADAARHADAA